MTDDLFWALVFRSRPYYLRLLGGVMRELNAQSSVSVSAVSTAEYGADNDS